MEGGTLGAAPAPAGGWRRLKRKSIPGNSISEVGGALVALLFNPPDTAPESAYPTPAAIPDSPETS